MQHYSLHFKSFPIRQDSGSRTREG